MAITMEQPITLFVCLSLAVFAQGQDRNPPGVPPYRGQGEEIRFHDPSDFRHEPPVPAQAPKNAGHHHSLRENLNHMDHVKTHIREEYVEVEKLSDSQLVMQHFRNYDLDKDGSIDGLEIMKAAHKMNEEHADVGEPSSIMDLEDETDDTMKAYDDNDDGIISYGEFYKNHMKALKGE